MKHLFAFTVMLGAVCYAAVTVQSGETVEYRDGDVISTLNVYGTVNIGGGADSAGAAVITVYDGGKVCMTGGFLTNTQSKIVVKKGGYFEQRNGTIDVNWFITESEDGNSENESVKILGGFFKTHKINNNGAFYPTGGKVLFQNVTLGGADGEDTGNFFPVAGGTKPWGALSETANFENDIKLENVTFSSGLFSPCFYKGAFGVVTGKLTVTSSTFRSEPLSPDAESDNFTTFILDNSKACFHYGYSFPFDFTTAWTEGVYVPPNNSWHELVITNDADVIASSTVYDDESCKWWELSDAEAAEKANYYVRVGTGELRVEGGRLAADVQMCPGGRLVVNGGKLVARNISSYNGMSSQNYVVGPGCDLFFNGGEILLPYYKSGTPSIGTFLLGDITAGSNYRHSRIFPFVVHHNGSNISMPEGNGVITFGRWDSHPGTARWEYRSGGFSDNIYMYTQISNVMEVVKIGSAQSPRIRYIDAEAKWGAFNKAVCEFVFDKSTEHISPWIFTDEKGRRFGSLRITLDGGVMVTKKDTFDLITLENGTLNSSNKSGYYDLPDERLWTECLSDDAKTSQVKLSSALGSAPATGGLFTLTAPAAMGSVSMTGVRAGGSLVESYIDLALQDASGLPLSEESMSGLCTAMIEAGYTNSTVLAEDSYSIRVAVPADALQSGDLRFVWDFTKRPGAWALATADDTVTETARVVSLRFSEYREMLGTLLFVR